MFAATCVVRDVKSLILPSLGSVVWVTASTKSKTLHDENRKYFRTQISRRGFLDLFWHQETPTRVLILKSERIPSISSVLGRTLRLQSYNTFIPSGRLGEHSSEECGREAIILSLHCVMVVSILTLDDLVFCASCLCDHVAELLSILKGRLNKG